MKKIITCALILAMLLTTFAGTMTFGASAAEITNVPEVVGIQTTAIEENTQNIRFVSEVSRAVLEEEISALGFDVLATFRNANGDVKQIPYTIEGTQVYTSLNVTLADGTNREFTPEYEGDLFFALIIKGVPTNLGDVFFDVKTYSRLDDYKQYSASAEFCLTDGAKSARKLIYAENFDGLAEKEDAEALALLDWTNTKLGTVDLKTSNDSVTINSQWSAYQFVEANESINKALHDAERYEVEMDVTVNKGPNVSLIFQTQMSEEGDKIGGFSIWVQLRGYKKGATLLADYEDGTTTGTLGAVMTLYKRKNNIQTENATNYCLPVTKTAQSNTAFVTDVNQKLNGVDKFGWKANPYNGISNTVHVKVVADNVANTMTLYINGVQIVTGYTSRINGIERISLLCQNDNAVIDNLTVVSN